MTPLSQNKWILVLLFILTSSFVSAQDKIDTVLLQGTWAFNKIEFGTAADDSANIRANWKGVVVTFKKGTCTTRIPNAQVYAGLYQFSADGKTFYQNDEETEVVRLDKQWFVVKLEDAEVTIYFKRVEMPK